jgi:hypothetical protein
MADTASSMVKSGVVSIAVTDPAADSVIAKEAALTLSGNSNNRTISYSPNEKK